MGTGDRKVTDWHTIPPPIPTCERRLMRMEQHSPTKPGVNLSHIPRRHCPKTMAIVRRYRRIVLWARSNHTGRDAPTQALLAMRWQSHLQMASPHSPLISVQPATDRWNPMQPCSRAITHTDRPTHE